MASLLKYKFIILLVFLFTALTALVVLDLPALSQLDEQITALIFRTVADIPLIVTLNLFITDFTIGGVVGVVIVIGILLALHRRRETFVFSMATIVLVLTERLLKLVIMRERPFVNLAEIANLSTNSFPYLDYSFPSGHTSMAFFIATFTSKIYTGPRKKWFIFFIFTLAVLVGLSRIVLGVHHVTDIFGGAILGTIFGLVSAELTRLRLVKPKMKFLILHGVHGHAGKHWMQWLHDQLVARGHQVIMPDLPDPEHPDRFAWLEMVKSLAQDINPAELIIIGHSLGIVAALDYAEQLKTPLFGLISAGGFYQDYGSPLNSFYMQQKQIAMDKVKTNLQHAAVLYGDDDPHVPHDELAGLATALDIEPIVIPGGGHLNSDAGYSQLPQILEVLAAWER